MIWRVLSYAIALLFLVSGASAKAASDIHVTNPENLHGDWALVRTNVSFRDRISDKLVPFKVHISFETAALDSATKIRTTWCGDDWKQNVPVGQPTFILSADLKCLKEHIQQLDDELASLFPGVETLLVERGGGLLRVIDSDNNELALLWRVGIHKLSNEQNAVWKKLKELNGDSIANWQLIKMKGLDDAVQKYLSNEPEVFHDFNWKELIPIRLKLSPNSKDRLYSVSMGLGYVCHNNSWVFDKRESGLNFYESYWQGSACGIAQTDKKTGEVLWSFYPAAIWQHMAKIMPEVSHVQFLETDNTLILKDQSLENLAMFKLKRESDSKVSHNEALE